MKTTTPSPAEMRRGLGRFAEVRSTEELYRSMLPATVTDAILPLAMPQKLHVVLAPEQKGRKADPACGHGPDDLVAMIAACDPGVGPPLHAHHLTHEIFFVARGRFRVEWGDQGEHALDLEEFDTLCVPPGCNRRFVNLAEHAGVMFAVALGHDQVLQDSAGTPATRERVLAAAPEVIEGVPTAEWLERMGLRYNAGVDDGRL